MRPAVTVVLITLALAAGPKAISAQSSQPFNGLSFTPATPSQLKAPAAFGQVLLPVAKLEVVQTAPLIETPRAPLAGQPLDCAMVKAIDPSFHSNMPVIRPDPNVHYTMPIVTPASCKPFDARGDAILDR